MRSPFKFLDAFTYKDRADFFGRTEEIEALYRMAFRSSLILIYGLSGTGKTSLVQCGLASRFDGPAWYPFFMRRNEDINQSLAQALQQALPKDATPVDTIAERVRYLFRYSLRPIYLIFDQFEEIFILGSESEQQQLGQTLVELTQLESVCKVILIIREEYVGELYNLEKYLPRLFDFRLRIEQMTYAKVKEVVEKSCANFNINFDGSSEESIQALYANIAGGKSGIQLPYLQVCLDQLYRQDFARTYPNGLEQGYETWPALTFSLQEITDLGNIKEILGRFLDEQKWQLEARAIKKYQSVPENAVETVLDAFVTSEGTKRPIMFSGKETNLTLESNVAQWLSGLSQEMINFIVNQLVTLRIIRQNDNSLELAHDALATLIDHKRSESQRRASEVMSRLLVSYKEYLDNQELLSKKQINTLEEFMPLLKSRLNKELLSFIDRSREELLRRENIELQAERKKRKLATRAALLAIGLAISIVVAFVIGSIKTKQIQKAKIELSGAFFKSQIQMASMLKVQGNYQEALNELKKIQALNKDFTPKQIDTLGLLQKNWQEVQQLVVRANSEKEDGALLAAISAYQKAQKLSPDHRVDSLITNAEKMIEPTYRKFMLQGQLSLLAKDMEGAKQHFRMALQLKPGDALATKHLKNLERK